jgi:hypothetical protein
LTSSLCLPHSAFAPGPWTFFLFIFILISPTILFLASLLLFPREGAVDESIDYKTHYYANHRAFFDRRHYPQ